MVCAYCGGETDVINSRNQKRNNQIWRRRRCQKCKAVFTTHEKAEYSSIFSVKTTAGVEPFHQERILGELIICLRGRQRPYEEALELTSRVTRNLFKNGREAPISANLIAWETAKVLKRFNKQAWLRYVAEHPSLQ